MFGKNKFRNHLRNNESELAFEKCASRIRAKHGAYEQSRQYHAIAREKFNKIPRELSRCGDCFKIQRRFI